MNRLPAFWAAAALLSLTAPLAARAQTTVATVAAAADIATPAAPATPAVEAHQAAVAAGPTLASASVAARTTVERPVVVVRSMASESAVPNALPPRGSARNSTALMIVGGAAFLAGAIVGDTPGTIMMVGGAGIGLYGLYLYLQ